MEELERRIAELEAALAERDVRIAALEETIRELKGLLEQLQKKASENSSNSNRPPSSDGPGGRKGKRSRNSKKKSGRKRGGQKGHKGNHCELLPLTSVDHIVHVFPETCSHGHAALDKVEDPDPIRHQVTELPEPKPEVTEYRCHGVTCPCGHRTRASLEGLADSAFGPRLSATIALLTGVYHLSRRTTQKVAHELLGSTSPSADSVTLKVAP